VYKYIKKCSYTKDVQNLIIMLMQKCKMFCWFMPEFKKY